MLVIEILLLGGVLPLIILISWKSKKHGQGVVARSVRGGILGCGLIISEIV